MEMVFFGHDFSYLEFFENIRRCIAEPDTRFRYFFSRIGPYLAAKEIKDSNLSCYYLDPDSVAIAKLKKPVSNLDLKFYTDIPNAHARCSTLFVKYLDYFNSCLPDVNANKIFFLLPGEFRLSEQAFNEAISNKYSSSVGLNSLYFESGPPGYIYLSPYGTNALANFDDVVKALVGSLGAENSEPEIGIKHSSYQVKYKMVLKVVDYVHILYQRYLWGRVDYQEYVHALKNTLKKVCLKLLKKDFRHNMPSAQKNEHSLLYCGQVNSDVNHTHFGVSTDEKIRKLIELMNRDSRVMLTVRHHPFFIDSKLEKALLLAYPGRVSVSKARCLSDDLELCSGVVTVNSNAGIESLLAGKPVLVLGDANYQGLHGVSSDSSIFLKSVRFRLDSKSIVKSTQEFLSSYFLKLDYRAADYANISIVADYISKYIKGKSFSRTM